VAAADGANRQARRLTRIPAEGRIAGVCAGIAAYLQTDVTFVRLAWVLLSIIPGGIIGGVIAYAAAWLLLPAGAEHPLYVGRRLFRSVADRKVGGVCGGLAEYFGTDATLVRLAVVILAIYPGAIVLGLLAYLIAWFIIPSAPAVPLQTAASTA
jgi:phage shock protein PspC (stress-responsive transcriptional regulator)